LSPEVFEQMMAKNLEFKFNPYKHMIFIFGLCFLRLTTGFDV